MAARSKRAWGRSPFAGIARSGPWGRRSACQLSCLSAFPPGSGSARHSVRSSSLDHLADDAQAAWRQWRAPRAESPGMYGRTSWLQRKVRQRSGPVPGTARPLPDLGRRGLRNIAQQGDQRGPVRHAELAVSSRQVMLDGAETEEEPLGDRLRISAVGSRQDDLALPGRQLAQVSADPHRSRMP